MKCWFPNLSDSRNFMDSPVLLAWGHPGFGTTSQCEDLKLLKLPISFYEGTRFTNEDFFSYLEWWGALCLWPLLCRWCWSAMTTLEPNIRFISFSGFKFLWSIDKSPKREEHNQGMMDFHKVKSCTQFVLFLLYKCRIKINRSSILLPNHGYF